MDLADVLSKVVGRPVDTACTLLESLLGEPFKIAGDALADHVRFWQWKNRLRILDRAGEIMRQRGINHRTLKPDFLLPFVRDCGDASDETLQEAWSRLLAAAVDDRSNEHIAFVNTLRSLDACDVKVASALIELGYMEREGRVSAISDRLGVPTELVQLSIHNLEHLGFFTPTQRRLKGFAVSFLRACIANDEALNRYLDGQAGAKRTIVRD